MLSNIFAGKVDGVKENSQNIAEKTVIDNPEMSEYVSAKNGGNFGSNMVSGGMSGNGAMQMLNMGVGGGTSSGFDKMLGTSNQGQVGGGFDKMLGATKKGKSLSGFDEMLGTGLKGTKKSDFGGLFNMDNNKKSNFGNMLNMGNNKKSNFGGMLNMGNNKKSNVGDMLNMGYVKTTNKNLLNNFPKGTFGNTQMSFEKKMGMFQNKSFNNINMMPERIGWNRMEQQKGLPLFGDFDMDKKLNAFDCNPLDRNKQGAVHDKIKSLFGKTTTEPGNPEDIGTGTTINYESKPFTSESESDEESVVEDTVVEEPTDKRWFQSAQSKFLSPEEIEFRNEERKTGIERQEARRDMKTGLQAEKRVPLAETLFGTPEYRQEQKLKKITEREVHRKSFAEQLIGTRKERDVAKLKRGEQKKEWELLRQQGQAAAWKHKRLGELTDKYRKPKSLRKEIQSLRSSIAAGGTSFSPETTVAGEAAKVRAIVGPPSGMGVAMMAGGGGGSGFHSMIPKLGQSSSVPVEVEQEQYVPQQQIQQQPQQGQAPPPGKVWSMKSQRYVGYKREPYNKAPRISYQPQYQQEY